MTNSRRRKDKKEFERGLRNGSCRRPPEASEGSGSSIAYRAGFLEGRQQIRPWSRYTEAEQAGYIPRGKTRPLRYLKPPKARTRRGNR